MSDTELLDGSLQKADMDRIKDELFNFNPFTESFLKRLNETHQVNPSEKEDFLDGLDDEAESDHNDPIHSNTLNNQNQSIAHPTADKQSFSLASSGSILHPTIYSTQNHPSIPQSIFQGYNPPIHAESSIAVLTERIKKQDEEISDLKGIRDSLSFSLTQSQQVLSHLKSEFETTKAKLEEAENEITSLKDEKKIENENVEERFLQLTKQLEASRRDNDLLRSQIDSQQDDIDQLSQKEKELKIENSRLERDLEEQTERLVNLGRTDTNAIVKKYREELEQQKELHRKEVYTLEEHSHAKDNLIAQQAHDIKKLEEQLSVLSNSQPSAPNPSFLQSIVDSDESDSFRLSGTAQIPSPVKKSGQKKHETPMKKSSPVKTSPKDDRRDGKDAELALNATRELMILQQEHSNLLQQHQQLLKQTRTHSTDFEAEFQKGVEMVWDDALVSIKDIPIAIGDEALIEDITNASEQTSRRHRKKHSGTPTSYSEWIRNVTQNERVEMKPSVGLRLLLELHQKRVVVDETERMTSLERAESSFKKVLEAESERHAMEIRMLKTEQEQKLVNARKERRRESKKDETEKKEVKKEEDKPHPLPPPKTTPHSLNLAKAERQLIELTNHRDSLQQQLDLAQFRLAQLESEKISSLDAAIRDCEQRLSTIHHKQLEAEKASIRREVQNEFQQRLAQIRKEYDETLQDSQKNLQLLQKGYEDKFNEGKERYKRKAEDLVYEYKKDAAKAHRMLQIQRIRHHETMGMFMEDLRESLNRTVECALMRKDEEIEEMKQEVEKERQAMVVQIRKKSEDVQKKAIEEAKKKQKQHYERALEKEKAKMAQKHKQELEKVKATVQRWGKPA